MEEELGRKEGEWKRREGRGKSNKKTCTWQLLSLLPAHNTELHNTHTHAHRYTHKLTGGPTALATTTTLYQS